MEIQRILDKYDRLMDSKEFEEAGRHLNYWVSEAEVEKDDRAAFALLNELVGFYRMQGAKEETVKAIEKLLAKTECMGLGDTVSGGTAYVNVATGYKSADMPEKALVLYRKALTVYERDLMPDDTRLSALYNNMAITLSSLKKYDEAFKYYNKALTLLDRLPDSENEKAITYLNMADLAYDSMLPEEAEAKVEAYVNKACDLLTISCNNKNPGFKFTAEKCIPSVKYHGYFMLANKLEEMLNSK